VPTSADTVSIAPVISGPDLSLVGLMIYTVNATTESVVSTTVMVAQDTEVTPVLVTDYIVDALEDESLTVSFEGIDYDNGICVVDFDDSIYAIANKSADLENAVLDAIAQSILDNVEGCMKVVYRIHDASYSTKNRTFAYDFVYMDN